MSEKTVPVFEDVYLEPCDNCGSELDWDFDAELFSFKAECCGNRHRLQPLTAIYEFTKGEDQDEWSEEE